MGSLDSVTPQGDDEELLNPRQVNYRKVLKAVYFMIMFSQKANGSNSDSPTAQDSQNSSVQNSEINTTPSESSTPINTTGSDSNTITAE